MYTNGLTQTSSPRNVYGLVKLSTKEMAAKLGIPYSQFYTAIMSGKVPDTFVNKGFDDLGHYQRRFFYEADVSAIKRSLEERAPSAVKVETPGALLPIATIAERLGVKRQAIYDLRAAGKWPRGFKPLPTREGMVFDAAVVEKLKAVLSANKRIGKPKKVKAEMSFKPLMQRVDTITAAKQEPANIKGIAVWLIKNGHTEAGCALLTDYKGQD